MTQSDLDAALRGAFPVRAQNERASLEYVEVTPRDGGWGVVIRLIVWDVDESSNQLSIRDIKEQMVWAGKLDVTPERFAAFLQAYDYVASRALTHAEIETLMPHDLVKFDALLLAKAHTDADFVKALSAKSRLGKYLPPAL